ncbi:MAG: putative toxin-antitoxin system toxin component, PIN family [Bacteroidales bacterium]|jgi:putative PIN family toxin of toxin-antitoxin system|nr:putative toxin-antitoxin system toxin component, PIN family [Bacteroidales bacterium]
MKIVLDTNCLLMILPKNTKYSLVWKAFCEGSFTLCYTTEILNEYFEILSRFYSPEVAKSVTETILAMPNVEPVTVYFNWNLITADPDDNKFVDCAICANARFIVSNDRHFDILEEIDFPKVDVLTIEEFKEIM